MPTSKGHILVVEDEVQVQSTIKETFQQMGCDVTTCFSAEEATKALLEGMTPDVIILDFLLPGESGPTFYQRISKDPRYAYIPVVPFTSLLNGSASGLGILQDFVTARDQGSPGITGTIIPKDREGNDKVPPALILAVAHAFERSQIPMPPAMRQTLRNVLERLR